MTGINSIGAPQINFNQTANQKTDNSSKTASVSFGDMFSFIVKSTHNVAKITGGNRAEWLAFKKEDFEIETAEKSPEDKEMEEANEMIKKIAQIMQAYK